MHCVTGLRVHQWHVQHGAPGARAPPLPLTKSVLGRVRNNIYEVLPYVVHELRHYRLYVKWVLYKLHVSGSAQECNCSNSRA